MRKVLHLLGLLDDSDVEWIATHGIRRSLGPGAELIRENKPIEWLYILLDGELSVCVQSLGNKQIAQLYPGEIVGELSFVDAQPPVASVIALTDCWVLALPRQLVSERIAKDNAFAARLYHSIAVFLADRLRTSVRRFGYGDGQQDVSVDELAESTLDNISLAAVRFDKMLRKLRGE